MPTRFGHVRWLPPRACCIFHSSRAHQLLAPAQYGNVWTDRPSAGDRSLSNPAAVIILRSPSTSYEFGRSSKTFCVILHMTTQYFNLVLYINVLYVFCGFQVFGSWLSCLPVSCWFAINCIDSFFAATVFVSSFHLIVALYAFSHGFFVAAVSCLIFVEIQNLLARAIFLWCQEPGFSPQGTQNIACNLWNASKSPRFGELDRLCREACYINFKTLPGKLCTPPWEIIVCRFSIIFLQDFVNKAQALAT